MLANFSWEIDNSCETCYVYACIYMNIKLNFENYNFTVQRYVVDYFWNSTVWDIKSLTGFKNPKTPGIELVID